MIAVIILSALLTSLVLFYFSRNKIYGNREKIGLSGPQTNWIFGNLHGFVERKWKIGYDDGYNWYLELHRQYGETFGIYVGSLLNIIVSREDDIKEIFIKNFSNFSDRYMPSFVERSCLSKSLFFSKYSDGWKTCRNAISPIFSSGSMKQLFGVVSGKVDVLLDILEEKSMLKEPFDIQEDFKALTLDVIAKCAFSIDSDCQRDRSDTFFIQAKDFVHNIDYRHSWVTSAGMFLQEFSGVWKALYRFSGLHRAETPFVQGLNDLVSFQVPTPSCRRTIGRCRSAEVVMSLNRNQNSNFSKSPPISQQEIVENCFAVLLGGYDTSSTSLSYLTYLLARNADVQEKLYREIEDVKEHQEQGLGYNSIMNMKYLNAVYKESLRLYPPVFHAVTRVSLQDIQIRDQLIPKGSAVTVTPYTVHRNEENWPNASQFLPERFLESFTDKHVSSLKWIPFGVGPRICVGMRFAEMEIKTTVVKLMERFQIFMDPEEPELVTECEGVVMQPRGPIHVELRLRTGDSDTDKMLF